MNLPVVFAVDRAGIVGEDGETHQGAFDISFLRAIPNMVLFAPRDEKSMDYALEFAYESKSPCSFRYPRGAFIECEYESKPFELGHSELLKEASSDILFIGYGNGVGRACQTAKLLKKDIALLDLKFVKPLDEKLLSDLAKRYKRWYIFSDSAKMGGVASALQELQIEGIKIVSFEYEDEFIPHGNTKLVEESLGITPKQLAKKIHI
jgi:1-deoxy-D-xylulose-5-phosphate synthase